MIPRIKVKVKLKQIHGLLLEVIFKPLLNTDYKTNQDGQDSMDLR